MTESEMKFGRLLGIDAIVMEGMSADGIHSLATDLGVSEKSITALMMDAYREGDAHELGMLWQMVIDAHLRLIADGDNYDWVISTYGGNNG